MPTECRVKTWTPHGCGGSCDPCCSGPHVRWVAVPRHELVQSILVFLHQVTEVCRSARVWLAPCLLFVGGEALMDDNRKKRDADDEPVRQGDILGLGGAPVPKTPGESSAS